MTLHRSGDPLFAARFLQLRYRDRQMIQVEDIDEVYQRDEDLLSVPTAISEVLKFPPGHPRKRVLYIGDPVVAPVYYPAAQFHRRTFERKFSEAVRLLESLGAEMLEVTCSQGWSNEFAANLNVPVGVKLSAGTSQAQKSQILYKAEYRGNRSRRIPDHMAWFPHEPAWQTIANSRLNHNLHHCELKITYEDDFGVNLQIVSKLKQLVDIELGGTFEQHQNTIWVLSGTFS